MGGNNQHANQYSPSGNLNVNLAEGTISGGNAAASPTGAAVPGSASYTGFQDGSGNLVGVSAGNPLPITGSISATNPSVGTNTATAPTSSTEVGIIDGSGKLQGVSATNPLPITGSISASNPSVGTTGATTPTSATLLGASDGTNLDTLLTESAAHANLRVAIYNGATETTVTGSNALKTDGSSVTQPISAASLPLPSGAATSAKQPALGTAGSASADVLTVQGVTSMTPLLVNGSGSTQPVSGTVTANAGTNLNTSALALESGGNLATLAGGVAASVYQENIKQVNGVTVLTGAGATGTGSQRITVAQDTTTVAGSAPGTAGSASANVITVQGVASMTKLLVTPDANSAINLAQIAATTTLVGNGVAGNGAQRVTVASDNTPFQVAASNETSSIYNGTTALTPLFSAIVASSSGATTIIALVSSKKIRVLAMELTASGAVNVKWQSHVTPTDLTGLAYFAANGGYVLPYNPVGWFQTVSGEALDINLSGAVAVGGSITYVTV